MAKTGPVSYRIRARGQEHRRHIDQLKKRSQGSYGVQNETEKFLLFPGQVEVELPQTHDQSVRTAPQAARQQPEIGRYSFRQHCRAPERYGQ